MDVSVIIPVYNAEDYLESCLASILAQTGIKFEVICINDASKDSSLELLNAAAKNDRRIKVIDLPQNHGQAYARNVGIKRAEGKCIYFLDSDDELATPEALLKLYKQLVREDVDCVCFDSNIEYESEDLRSLLAGRSILNESIEPGRYSGEEYFNKFFSNPGFSVAVWRQFWKKEFLINNDLLFHEDTSPHEDLLFTFQAFYLLKNVVYIPEAFHKYRFRAYSSSSGKVDLRRLKSYQKIYIESLKFLEKHSTEKRKISAECLSKYFRSCLSPIHINYARIVEEGENVIEHGKSNSENNEDFYRNWIIMQRFPLLERVFTKDEILVIKDAKTVIVYGAGTYSIRIQQMLLDFGVTEYNVCVPKSSGKETEISEMKNLSDSTVIIMAVSSLYKDEMKGTALSLGFENIIDLQNS